MAENTLIEWADHTFNPWVGCTKVSPACDHCYAEGWAKRSGQVEWGGERKRTSQATWRKPYQWNNNAALDQPRARVFCASLADVFDNQVPPEWRRDLFWMIRETPNLDWLLLTKRPQNIAKMLPDGWDGGWPNVWLGTTVENQEEADRRIPHLLATPATIRFLSCEPLLGPIHLHPFGPLNSSGLHWVIVGGESGGGARPMHPDWARSLRNVCQAAGVAYHFKQWGEWLPAVSEDTGEGLVFWPDDGRDLEGDFSGWGRHPVKYLLGQEMWRVGKKRAGRLLDGREWNEFPGAEHD